MRKVEKINSQSDCWPTNYRYKFHCSHKTQSRRCIQNTTENERLYAKAKRQKIKHSTKKTTIEAQRKKKKRKRLEKKNQQFETLNIIVSEHMAEAFTKRPMAPPIIPIEIYGIQWTMIVHSEWTKPTRLSFSIQRRANECERKHRIIEPIPESMVSGCATATAITKLLPLGGAQDKDRVVFMRFAVSFSVSHFCGE